MVAVLLEAAWCSGPVELMALARCGDTRAVGKPFLADWSFRLLVLVTALPLRLGAALGSARCGCTHGGLRLILKGRSAPVEALGRLLRCSEV